MNEKDQKTQKGMSMKGQRTLAYIVLIIISFFCLFWFYVLFINATRKTGRACLPEHFRYGMVCSTVFSLLPVLLFYVPISPP